MADEEHDHSSRLTVTMPFLQAYAAMRGPSDGDVGRTPLFGCLAPPRTGTAGSDEVELLREVHTTLDEDFQKRLVFYDDDEDTTRRTTFTFDRPQTSDVVYSEPCAGGSKAAVMADHVVDDGEADSRISAAEFRALSSGCRRNDVDQLRIPVTTTQSARPLTPQHRVVDLAREPVRMDARVFGGRRQFDPVSGDELSPAYRVDAGRSVLWSPGGVTPERGGAVLAQGDGGMLYRRMAPESFRELRGRLYGGLEEAADSSSTSSESEHKDADGNKDDDDDDRAKPFGWSEVNEAVAAHARETGRPIYGQARTADEVRASLQQGWQQLRQHAAAETQLEAANVAAEAAVTAQARRLVALEQRVAQQRQAAEQARRRRQRRQQRIVYNVALQLREVQTAVRMAEERVARGRELQAVLVRRRLAGAVRMKRLEKELGEWEEEEGGEDEDIPE